jgi:hypothetical protein
MIICFLWAKLLLSLFLRTKSSQAEILIQVLGGLSVILPKCSVHLKSVLSFLINGVQINHGIASLFLPVELWLHGPYYFCWCKSWLCFLEWIFTHNSRHQPDLRHGHPNLIYQSNIVHQARRIIYSSNKSGSLNITVYFMSFMLCMTAILFK